MTEIENFATLQLNSKPDDDSTLFNTLESPHHAFLTAPAKPPSAS